MVKVTVELGASAAIGFQDVIYCAKANEWMINFYSKMLSGSTLDEAVRVACERSGDPAMAYDKITICGDKNIRLH